VALTRPPVDPAQPGPFAGLDPAGLPADGPVAIGADLSPASLVGAYRGGFFPVPASAIDPASEEGQAIAAGLAANRPGLLRTVDGSPPDATLTWWNPDPRCALWPEHAHVSRTLRGRLRTSGWTTTVDAAFDDVVRSCRREGPLAWITPELRAAYRRLHALGWAHSVEVWAGQMLAGGLFGIGVGAVFAIESMFHRVTDASKAAMIDLADRFGAAGGRLIDVQLPSAHLLSMGARELPRARFLEVLDPPAGDGRVQGAVRWVVDRLPVDRLRAFPRAG